MIEFWRDLPSATVLPIHAIFGLLAQASDVLMIGCGGGSLGTMAGKVRDFVQPVLLIPPSVAADEIAQMTLASWRSGLGMCHDELPNVRRH
ncbi:hypothetical protein LGH82_04835 [Mesorhizobium sp. PAMC28654]|uniref:hypothetical protein n=1 Tax=Mesorhizobium sp. PAMC28654 TaxID=2880934 RepID=UPI001D09F7DB|nr:hypothetical protein [Mesorhizobium sp. PAMC28654]UDL90662.1 hypothetical protein LGH82_04835 [Mesorhizobium sp. PAMC28654]